MKRLIFTSLLAMLVLMVACDNSNEDKRDEQSSAIGEDISNNEKPSDEQTNTPDDSEDSSSVEDDGGYGDMPIAPYVALPIEGEFDMWVQLLDKIKLANLQESKTVVPENLILAISLQNNWLESNEQLEWELLTDTQQKLNTIKSELRDHSYDGSEFYVSYYTSQYVYAPLSFVEITANKPLWGRNAGENLSDMFYLYWMEPNVVFSYPDCHTTNVYGDYTEVYNWQEVLQSSLFPTNLLLAIKEPFQEVYTTVTFDVKIGLGNSVVLHRNQYVRFE